ncbi:SAS053 family DNA gyrase inhibitor [Mammaliicoccus vitulinus]|nr:SAS053 family protein [Mammaliicoccus vitulinus]
MELLNKNPEEENEMVQDLDDVKELGKEMEQISEQNDEAYEEKKEEQDS